jgi:hypothetical protein
MNQDNKHRALGGFILGIAQAATYILGLLGVVLFGGIFKALLVLGARWYLIVACVAVGLVVLLLVTNLNKAVDEKNVKLATWTLAAATAIFILPIVIIAGITYVREAPERREKKVTQDIVNILKRFNTNEYEKIVDEGNGYLKGKMYIIETNHHSGDLIFDWNLGAVSTSGGLNVPRELLEASSDEPKTIIIIHHFNITLQGNKEGSDEFDLKIIDKTIPSVVATKKMVFPLKKPGSDETNNNRRSVLDYIKSLPQIQN